APPAAVAKAAPSAPAEKAAPAPAAAPTQPSPAPSTAAPASPPPAVSEKAAPAVANVAPAAGRAGTYRIQLASVGDRKAAEGEWRRLTRANGDVLGKLTPSVVTVDLAGKGTFHRLSAGPFADRGAAAEACEALHKRKVGCFVVAP
ncbi:SPOR domain-containing protein, partial [Desertibaculum subflavum]|uniref:SPOR domain-containing protein n=1 Tax=Desertibaculum subflavum TaxID=2268458 RepID=UPI0034D180EB